MGDHGRARCVADDLGGGCAGCFVITLDLPIPTSVNGLYIMAGKKGRVISPGYSAWLRDANHALAVQIKRLGSPRLADNEPWGISLRINTNRRSDIDNRAKAILDLLVKAEIVPDDRWCDVVIIRRDNSVCQCRVVVAPIEFFGKD